MSGHSYKGRRNPFPPVAPLADYGDVSFAQVNEIIIVWMWTGGNPPSWGLYQDDGSGPVLVDTQPGDFDNSAFVPTDGFQYYVVGLDNSGNPYGTPSPEVTSPFP